MGKTAGIVVAVLVLSTILSACAPYYDRYDRYGYYYGPRDRREYSDRYYGDRYRYNDSYYSRDYRDRY